MTGLLTIGVIGLGSIGRRHARLLAERRDVEIRVFDPDPTAAAGLEGLPAATSADELLAGCDAVVIAAPDPFHAPLTVAACRAGCPVLVEKPVSDSLAAAAEMAEVARSTEVPVLVGHVLRYLPVLQHVEAIISTGAIGTPVSFHATLGAYETLEAARMRFSAGERYRLPFDYTHEWHYIQWLLGPVTRCVAAGHLAGELPLRQDPNVLDVLVQLESGVTGSVHLDYVERAGARSVRIVGDRGSLEADVRAGTVGVRYRDGRECRARHPEERDAAFRRQLDHFVDVAVAGTAPCVTIADGARALAVAEAVVRSCEERTWQTVAL